MTTPIDATHHLGFPIETVAVFAVLSIGAIFIDLHAHRDDKPKSLKSASLWTVFWILVSLAFAGFLAWHHGATAASLFITGYALEKVLSVDNLFVMMAIFAWFKVPEGYRHRVLYWGIIGAIIFRMIFVAIGTGLLALGPYVEIIFALVVAYTAVMMLKSGGDDGEEIEDYSDHIAYRWVHRFFPVWPLLLCLAVIEISDVMFAFDSVPAVIAVSREPLIVYSAMMFAILGLRTMYFVLEALKGYLVHLEKAVIVLLFFIAAKLALSATNHLFHHGFDISPVASLIVVLVVLAAGVVASVLYPEKAEEKK